MQLFNYNLITKKYILIEINDKCKLNKYKIRIFIVSYLNNIYIYGL